MRPPRPVKAQVPRLWLFSALALLLAFAVTFGPVGQQAARSQSRAAAAATKVVPESKTTSSTSNAATSAPPSKTAEAKTPRPTESAKSASVSASSAKSSPTAASANTSPAKRAPTAATVRTSPTTAETAKGSLAAPTATSGPKRSAAAASTATTAPLPATAMSVLASPTAKTAPASPTAKTAPASLSAKTTPAAATATSAPATPTATNEPEPPRATSTPLQAASAPPPSPSTSPTHSIKAISGDATANAGQSQTTLTNAQTSQATTGGGTGLATVENQRSAAVTGGGRSSSTTGAASVVGVPPGTTSSGAAKSGDASANGLTTENLVSNTANADVQVAGANQAPIKVQSSSTVSIQDSGVATAQSGPASVAEPNSAQGGAATVQVQASASSPVSATGLTAQMDVANTLETNRVEPGGSANQTPITITQTQNVSILAGGSAAATSGEACTTPVCSAAVAPVAAAPQSAPTTSQSGAADAQGLVATNTVTMDATASVSVGGQNFAPIQIVIDAVTSLANWGSAQAASGSAASVAAAAVTPSGTGASAGSGDANATGARVTNQVDLTSSAFVHVLGDNYSPITIVTTLAVSFLNWGVGEATSGNAETAGQMNATTGSAYAMGLLVRNIINLKASAFVVIDGDNYAPIYIRIGFRPTIDNRGWAQASSGSARGVSNATQTQRSGGSRTAAANAAHSGAATVVADTISVRATSQQSASANAIAAVQALDSPPPTMAVVVSGTPVSGTLATTPEMSAPGTSDWTAASGAALASGLQVTVDDTNSQVSACVTPESACVARNGAGLAVDIDPEHIVEPSVPTIPPARAGNRTSRTPPREEAPARNAPAVQRASGSTVIVHPWDNLPGRRLPPLPKQAPLLPPGTLVSQDPWRPFAGAPGALPEPVPLLSTAEVQTDAQGELPATSASAGARGTTSGSQPNATAASVSVVAVTPQPQSNTLDLERRTPDIDRALLPHPTAAAVVTAYGMSSRAVDSADGQVVHAVAVAEAAASVGHSSAASAAG